MQNLWRRDMEITETDRRWLDRVENYVTNRDELLPLQERFNAGQKLFYWLMFYGALLLLFSGFFMWIPEYIPRQAAWIRPLMVLIHEIAALATIGGFIIHIYMGVFFVPDSMTGDHHRLGVASLGQDASSLVVPPGDGRPVRREMKASLDARIARASELAKLHPSAASLLSFYRELAQFQKRVLADVQSKSETDVRALALSLPRPDGASAPQRNGAAR